GRFASSRRRLVEPERRALIVFAELEAPEPLLGVLAAAVVERDDLAAELCHARERRVHVGDGEEDVRRRARVTRMHAARNVERRDHPPVARRTGLELPAEQALVE